MAVSLILYIGFIFIFNIITPDKTFSESENRMLQKLPKFSLEKLLKKDLTSKYENYICDQFTFRDYFIGIKSTSERIMGKKENNDVYLGKDNLLLQKFKKPTDTDFKEKINAINSFASSTPNLNKYLMIVPTATKILEDKLPLYAPIEDELKYINQTKNKLDKKINFVSVYDELYSKKNEYIFYKTDHHWTTDGAYYAYKKLIKEMGFTPHSKNYFNVKKVTDNFYGSLYSKGGFRNLSPDSINLYVPKVDEKITVTYSDKATATNSLYDMNSLNKKDKYTVFFGGNHSLIRISTNIKNNKKLLVVKDSYANCFIPFLTGHYNEIYVVDLRYYNDNIKDLIKSNNINDMLVLYNATSFFQDTFLNSIGEK